jgi:hypothetical protein
MYHLYKQFIRIYIYSGKRKKAPVLPFLLVFFFTPTILSAAQVLSESFTDCVLPEGWEVTDSVTPSACNWMVPSHNPIMFNDTGGEGCFALADSEYCGTTQAMDTALVTPSMNCSGMRETILTFKYDALAVTPTSNSTFKVEISTNGGDDWTELWNWSFADDEYNDPGYTATINIKDIADREPSVRLRFHYTASNELRWQVDNVTVSGKRTSNLSWLMLLLNKTK